MLLPALTDGYFAQTSRSMLMRSAMYVSFLSGLTSLVSFVNQLLVARYFGASIHLDGYMIAVSVPYLGMGAIAGVFSYSIVPILVREKTIRPYEYREFSGSLFLAVIGFALCVPGLACVVTPTVIQALAPALPTELMEKIILMARISWVTVGCTFVVNYLVAVQNSARKFVVPAMVIILPYLGMIVALLGWHHQLGISSLVWGMLVGYILAIPIAYQGAVGEIRLRRIEIQSWRRVGEVLSDMPLILASMLCFTVYGTIDSFWVYRLGPGNLSYLGYAQKLVVSLGSVVVLGPGVVLTPYLSEISAGGFDVKLRETISKAIRMIIVVAAPVAMGISILKIPIIELLFQRGAFDPMATLGVASVLPGMLFGMVAMSGVVLLFRALYSSGDIHTPALIGGVGTVMYFTLSGILSNYFGLQGIVFSYAITWWALFVFSVYRVWRGSIISNLIVSFRFVLKLFFAMFLSCVVLVLGKYFIIKPLLEIGILDLSMRLLLLSALGILSFILSATFLVNISEVKSMMKV